MAYNFKDDRDRISKLPKNIRNLIEYMQASASMGEVYTYVLEFDKQIRDKIEKEKKRMGGDLAYYVDVRTILGDRK